MATSTYYYYNVKSVIDSRVTACKLVLGNLNPTASHIDHANIMELVDCVQRYITAGIALPDTTPEADLNKKTTKTTTHTTLTTTDSDGNTLKTETTTEDTLTVPVSSSATDSGEESSTGDTEGKHVVLVGAVAHGSASLCDSEGNDVASGSYVTDGATLVITATASDGYQFDHWQCTGLGFDTAYENPLRFATRHSSATLTPVFVASA